MIKAALILFLITCVARVAFWVTCCIRSAFKDSKRVNDISEFNRRHEISRLLAEFMAARQRGNE